MKANEKKTTRCKGCGKVFTFSPYGKDKQTRAYCSQDCYRNSRKSRTWTDRECRWCKNPFRVRTCYTQRSNDAGWYCSKACVRLGRRKGLPRESTIFKCERCGKTFSRVPSSLTKPGRYPRYCSWACRSTIEDRNCLTCGTAFSVRATDPKRYCSNACYRKSASESLIEATVRRELELAGVPFVQEQRLGNFTIDFVIGDAVAIEVDGGYWHGRDGVAARDDRKAQAIRDEGMRLFTICCEDMGIESKLLINRTIACAVASLAFPDQIEHEIVSVA